MPRAGANALKGRPRRTLTAAVRARNQPCRMCGYPIDQRLDRQRHPLGSVVDEWKPRAAPHYGDPLDPTNCAETHRVCNGVKGDRYPVTDAMRARCRELVEAILQGNDPRSVQIRRW